MKLHLTHCLVAFLLTAVVIMVYLNRPIKEGFEEACGSCDKEGGSKNLLPVFDPLYNAREWCKQSILLEDHLTHPRKQCKDCITKHCLTLEALAEEACTLDKESKYQHLLGGLAEKCRDLQKDLLAGRTPQEVAQGFRKIRKDLMPHCRESF